MLSVRVTAAGAVVVVCLSFLTAPARACDDRFIKKCEKASAAAAAAEEAAAAPVARRSASKRVKVIASRQAKHSRFVRRAHAPRFAARSVRPVAQGQAERMTASSSQTALSRRFQGFIDPQPIAQNAFEALRKPHAMALDFEAAAIVPLAESAEIAAAEAAPAISAASIATTPKQDKLVAKPAALIELASAESRPIVLPDLPAAKPGTKQATAAPVMVAEASSAPAGQEKSGFSFHGLVLALCGALGAASALRFVVGV